MEASHSMHKAEVVRDVKRRGIASVAESSNEKIRSLYSASGVVPKSITINFGLWTGKAPSQDDRTKSRT
jgi:hypothetical protein